MKKNNFLAFFSDLGSPSDWLKQISQAARPIRNTTQIWEVTRHQYGISALASQTSFCEKTCGGVAKCPLFSQARHLNRPRNHKQIILTARSYVFLNLIRFYLSNSITLQKNPGVYGFLSFLVTII